MRSSLWWCGGRVSFYARAMARQQPIFIPYGMIGKIRGGQGVTQGAALKRVLVIKHGALGDMVQGFDALAGLRAGLPDTHLALLTTPPFLNLAGRMP